MRPPSGPATANSDEARPRSRSGTRSGATASSAAWKPLSVNQARHSRARRRRRWRGCESKKAGQRKRGHAGEPGGAAAEAAGGRIGGRADDDEAGDAGGGADHRQPGEVGDLGRGVERLDAVGHEDRLHAVEGGVERDGGRQEKAEGALGEVTRLP